MISRVGRAFRYARRGQYREDKREPVDQHAEVKAVTPAPKSSKR